MVQVLGRQDGLFKRKFFDCLMSKLWDTTLPYEEYYQLNKLMTALFGENYHKMEKNSNSPPSSQQQQHPHAHIPPQHPHQHATAYAMSNGGQGARANRLDAEHVVNLVRAYLDQTKCDEMPAIYSEIPSNLNNSHPPHIHPQMAAVTTTTTSAFTAANVISRTTPPQPPLSSSPPLNAFDSYSSVSNLISTLKRRKKQSDRRENGPNLMTLFQSASSTENLDDDENAKVIYLKY